MQEDHESQTMSIPSRQTRYTEKQGQYLAFIYYYTKVNRYPPAEADMQNFFEVSAPSVHRMLVDLERKRLIERKPRQARSVRVLLQVNQLPDLL
jgi:Mn-dependent DtxR family transcriptional regulator